MKKKINILMMIIGVMVVSLSNFAYAEVDQYGNEIIAPGTKSYKVDFSNITKGLYFDGSDYYYVLEQGVYATNYLLNLHGDKYYFNDEGKMIKDEIIDHDGEKYYFDPNGTMVKNTWVTQQETDPDDGSVVSVTYYFGPSGRAYRAVNRSNNILIKDIDGMKYGFNDEGARFEGYVTKEGEIIEDVSDEEAIDLIQYYFDPEEDYATAAGWILYEGKRPDYYPEDEELYLYFDEKTGRKVCSSEPGKYIARVIEGERYLFDYYGIRQRKWHQVATTSTPRYYGEDYEGFLTKGWFLAIPSPNSIEEKNRQYSNDEEEQWYYAGSDGKVVRNCIKKIGKYYYCFDQDGVMQCDCMARVKGNAYVAVYKTDDLTVKEVIRPASDGGKLEPGEKWMYFMEPEDEDKVGAMCPINKEIKIELGDDVITFITNASGGYGKTVDAPVERSGKFVQNGVVLKPAEDMKYGIVKGDDGNYYAVNNRGNKVTTRGAYKNENGDFVLLGNQGILKGIYKFAKCRLAQSNSTPTWICEDDLGEEVICQMDDEDSISQYKIEDISMYYLNFSTMS